SDPTDYPPPADPGPHPDHPDHPDGAADGKVGKHRTHWPRWLPKPIRRVAKLLLAAFVIQYLVLPQVAGTRKAISVLGKVHLTYLLAGLGLEMAAIVAYAILTRTVLPRQRSPSVFNLLRVQLSTLAVSHVVPGGTAAGSPLGYRLLTAAGVDGPDAAFALATQGLGSAVVLNAILWLALVISIPLNGFNPLYLAAAGVGVLAIGGFAVLIVLLTRGEERSAALLSRLAARIPFVDPATINDLVHRLAARIRELGADRNLLVRASTWAVANWLLDAASLWVFIAAYGYRVSPDGLLVAFGLANVLAAIPITPGGLGVVEAVLTSTLVGFGVPPSIAIIGVATYRLANFWLPIPFGGLAYLSLQVDPGDSDLDVRQARRDRRAQKFRRLFESVSGTNEDRRG
ncbi:MAG: flippase-like domain-containing protein, partial [Actinomycetota bacterium]|nr:flippase-like domain-containing protein [Actinomycetota bacterium]